MIPLCLRLAGFLSYRDPVELDFTAIELACISGPNGAGKSTLLDAITWALFGQARRRDDSLINLQSKAAEVALTFQYEGAVYRIQRTLLRGKTPILEFQVQQSQVPAVRESAIASNQVETRSWRDGTAVWFPLTERTLRDTQSRIETILRLDYDTFVNASFFLQGKADQFAKQTPARRKEVLSNILGLEAWEAHRARAAQGRRILEDEVSSIDGRRSEISAELAEEDQRRQRLEMLEAELARLGLARRSQESAVESMRRAAAALAQQEKMVEALTTALERSRSQLNSLTLRLAEREQARDSFAGLRAKADDIAASYASWQRAQAELQLWETSASTFHDHEQHRQPLLEAIAVERARLEEERRSLKAEEQELDDQAAAIRNLEGELGGLRASLADAERRLSEREGLQAQLSAARVAQTSAKAENEVLRDEMESLRGRIDALESASGATCPLCGQSLSPAHRKATLKSLQAEGKKRGDRFRSNKAALEGLESTIATLELNAAEISSAEAERLACAAAVAQLSERLDALHAVARTWESSGLRRLIQVQESLASDKFALDARKQLAKVDKSLARLGYDAAAHDAARRAELDLRPADEARRQLESALAALAPLEDEIGNLRGERPRLEREVASQEADVQSARENLEASLRAAPDLDQAERALLALQEQENALNRELGAARQKVAVLNDLRIRDAEFESTRASLALQIGRHKILERAFGKDGVPALLIEQALPQIESRANELLDRLSDGRMSVRFVTQSGYKDRKREDLRETLEIQISDGAGIRDYELYSGGEAFRIDFAVRLALSEVLAARKGARLQTLVIDEGFGSQDDQGRQRLIEAINLVKKDFALVLVITHLDELKDAFPARIEVEKTQAGSTARIL